MAAPFQTAFIYSERYGQFDYGPEHPFRIERLALTYDLCQAYGLLSLPATRLMHARDATEEEVAAFHRPDYVDVLRAADRGQAPPNVWDYGLFQIFRAETPGPRNWACALDAA